MFHPSHRLFSRLTIHSVTVSFTILFLLAIRYYLGLTSSNFINRVSGCKQKQGSGSIGPIRTRPYFVFVSMIGWPIYETKTKYDLVRIGPLVKNSAPQRQAVGTFDVCLARPKVCFTDIVRPHVAQLMIDTSVNQFCKIWTSADWPIVSRNQKLV